MSFHDIKFRLSRERLFSDEIGLRMFIQRDDGIALPEPIVMKFVKNEDLGSVSGRGPDIVLPVTSAQQLMDELWNVGLRPTDGSGSAGSLAATERHLSDMRALVAKAHGMEMPK